MNIEMMTPVAAAAMMINNSDSVSICNIKQSIINIGNDNNKTYRSVVVAAATVMTCDNSKYYDCE
jgi:hypothetical protein